MTEKRFTYDEFEDSIIDNLSGKTHWGLDDILNNKLNQLHEENEQLKDENEKLKQQLSQAKVNHKEYHKISLHEENRQLGKVAEKLEDIDWSEGLE